MDKKSLEQSAVYKGKNGETLACEFLQNKGYRILHRNYVFHSHEVDIIARDANNIVFVEVKLRQTDAFGLPYDAVDRKKQKFIISVANAYIQQMNIDLEARFDIISIVFKPMEEPEILHIENAFTPSPL
ncbi:MAG: YraN family protein [Bacteroidales bacterium]|nr:YraN family protein [Bacteroidales bacterium]